MKPNKILLVLSLILSVLAVFAVLVEGLNYVRLDKIPIIRYFVLEIELWPSGFDASYLNTPITWQQLDEEPVDWKQNGAGSWFSFNRYTKRLLKEYMRKNNLGIVPDSWLDLKFTADFECCLETFEFVKLDESFDEEKVVKDYFPLFLIMSGCLAILSWLLWWAISKRKG